MPAMSKKYIKNQLFSNVLKICFITNWFFTCVYVSDIICKNEYT